MPAESMSLRDMLFWIFLTVFGTGTYVIYGSQSTAGEAWGVLMIAGGFVGMVGCMWPHLKDPVSGKLQFTWVRLKTTRTIGIVLAVAVLGSTGIGFYRYFHSPIKTTVFVPAGTPETTPQQLTATIPLLPLTRFNTLISFKGAANALQDQKQAQQPLSSAEENTRSESQALLQPFPADAPLACPPPGVIAEGWLVGLQQMESGIPIQNGPIKFVIEGPSRPDVIYHPLLRGKVNLRVRAFRGAEYSEARAFLDDLGSRIGSPGPIPYKSTDTVERSILHGVRRFQNSQVIETGYMDGTVSGNELIRAGTIMIRIDNLSARSQVFVGKMDKNAKDDADQSCRDALRDLTDAMPPQDSRSGGQQSSAVPNPHQELMIAVLDVRQERDGWNQGLKHLWGLLQEYHLRSLHPQPANDPRWMPPITREDLIKQEVQMDDADSYEWRRISPHIESACRDAVILMMHPHYPTEKPITQNDLAKLHQPATNYQQLDIVEKFIDDPKGKDPPQQYDRYTQLLEYLKNLQQQLGDYSE